MKVRFKSDFFAPNGQFYRKGIHSVPDDWKPRPEDGKLKDGETYLPRTAEVVTEEKPAPKPAPSPKPSEK